jgi:cytochrome b561
VAGCGTSVIRELRAWAQTHTERSRYSPVGIAFHWIMAFLVMFQLGWGYYTSWLPAGGDKLHAFEVHSAVGLPILLLALARFGWRLMIPGPVNDADTQGWQSVFASAIHILFYVAFFGLPLSGWAMWSSVAEPGPLYLAGVVPWPQLPFDQLALTTRWWIMVGDVEGRPVPGADVEVEKVNDVAIGQAVDDVAQGAAEDQRQGGVVDDTSARFAQ